MRYRKDWAEAAERWTALWEGRLRDRPCMVVTAPRGKASLPPPPESPDDLYLDPDYIVRAAMAKMGATHYAAEAIPSMLMLAGWVTTCYDSTPRFETERNTIWFDVLDVDWDAPPSFDLDMNAPWFRRYEALHRAMVAAAGEDGWSVGQACVLPGHDILSMLLGTETFLTSMLDRPEWMETILRQVARNWVTVIRQ